MVPNTARFSFKLVLAALPPGEPVCTRDLESMAIPAYQASYLARHNWLRCAPKRKDSATDSAQFLPYLWDLFTSYAINGMENLLHYRHNNSMSIDLWRRKPTYAAKRYKRTTEDR
jgi:hypothetical protein